jgi:hypothetical protein
MRADHVAAEGEAVACGTPARRHSIAGHGCGESGSERCHGAIAWRSRRRWRTGCVLPLLLGTLAACAGLALAAKGGKRGSRAGAKKAAANVGAAGEWSFDAEYPEEVVDEVTRQLAAGDGESAVRRPTR